MNNQQMTWEEIKNKYPHQYVGLIDVEYGINNTTINSAVVKYTSSDLSYNKLINLYLQGEIILRYTTLDEDNMRYVMDETPVPSGRSKKDMSQQIMNKLGFDIEEYNSYNTKEAHEKDNIPNPFDKLTMEELLYLRENNYLLKNE